MNRETGERAEAFVVIGKGADEPGLLHWQTDGDLSDHSGASRLEVPIDALGGAGALTYWHVDDAGNVSEKGVLPVDVVPPAKLTVQAVHPAMRVSEDSIPMHAGDLKILGLEPDAGWRYRIDDGEWTDGEGDTLSDEALRQTGRHEVLLIHVDVHGNESDVHHLPIEVAGPLKLRLKNDTGLTPQQKVDLVTSDATVEVLGAGALHGAVEYRIDAGTWQPLGDGKVIGNSLFPGDGKRRVEVRIHDANGKSLPVVDLHIEVDRTAPDPSSLVVVNERAKVNASGIPVQGGLYSLTNQALVRLPGLEEGATWSAGLYKEDGFTLMSEVMTGSGDRLPKELFREGPQWIGAWIYDRAGNFDEGIQLAGVFLDTTPPPKPTWKLLEATAEGGRSYLLDSPGRDAHFEHRRDGESTWTRLVSSDSLTGPLEVRQVDLAGNASEGALLASQQILDVTGASLNSSVL